MLFCKLIVALPREEIQNPKNSNLQNKLSGLLDKVLSSFGFNALKFGKKDVKSLKIVKLLKTGKGLYYIRNKEFWIHIGSTNANRLQEFESLNGDLFWKTAANLIYGIYGITKVNITVTNAEDEKHIIISPLYTINFAKFAEWSIGNTDEQMYNYFNNAQMSFFNSPENIINFKFLSKSLYLNCFSRVVIIRSKEQDYSLNRVEMNGVLLPCAKYANIYRFCDKKLEYFLLHLQKILTYKIDKIIINFSEKCKHINNSDINESLTVNQFVSEAENMLKAVLESNDEFKAVDISICNEIDLDKLLAIVSKSGKCKIRIVCLCGDKAKCPNKEKYELRAAQSENISFSHME